MDDHNKADSKSLWSDLPPEVISNIESFLDSGVDVCQLHSVCKNWHSSRNPNHIGLLSPTLPLIISNANLPFTDRSHVPLILLARAVFLVKPLYSSPTTSYGWFLTVEEVVPGKLRILYPLSTNRVKHLPSNCPKYLDLSKFRVSQIVKSYVLKYESDGEDVPGVTRVVCCGGFTAMVLYGRGTLIGLSLKTGNWSFVRQSLLVTFSDVITDGGNHVQAIDCRGNVHFIDHSAAKVVKSIFFPPICPDYYDHIKLSRLSGELFIATYRRGTHSTGILFTLYRLDEAHGRWIDAASEKHCSKALFVSSEWSFFLYRRDLDLCNHSSKDPKCSAKKQTNETIQFGYCKEKDVIEGDYVIYSVNSFPCHPQYCNQSRLSKPASLDLDIGVCFLNGRNSTNLSMSLCSTTSDVLWPPPTWFWPDTDLSTRDTEELEQVHFSAAADASSRVATLKKRGGVNSIVPTIQNLDMKHSTVEFEGLSIKSNLVPSLQKVWVKYGNILEGSMIRNTDMVARALESLGTALIILETSSGISLNKTQADFLNSVLCDLQHINFKVDWLVPFVENALAAYKSKPLIDSLKEFGRAKAEAAEMKHKLLDELAKMDEVEDMALVSEKLAVLESMDFDRSLGEGLY